MKKNSKSSRALALVLALVMVLSLMPTGVFAAKVNDLYTGDTGIKTDTLGDEGFINWPVKIYDYLDDGMLFESAQANITDATVKPQDSYKNGVKYIYGGGDPAPFVKEGSDFTGDAWFGTYAPWKTVGFSNRFTITEVTPNDYDRSTATTEDDPFENPRFVRVTKSSATSGSYAFCLKNFTTTTSSRSTGYLKLSSMRYMVLTYKATGLSDENDLAIWLEKSGGDYLKPSVTITDSTEWRSVVIDMKAIMGSTDWSTYESTNMTALYLYMPSLNSTDKLDISHVAFFSGKTEAQQFGIDAEDFSNNPGELLTESATISTNTTTITTLPLVERPGYTLSARYRYDANDTSKLTTEAPGAYYGLDLTTKSTANGTYTTGYGTDVYGTWKNGTNTYLEYTGVSSLSKNYTMNAMTVTELTESNGQGFVRLTNASGYSGKNRIILTRFMERENGAPLTSDVNYAVLVYRANNWSGSDRYGFWANGHNGAGTYRMAGMEEAANWQSSGYISKLSPADSGDLWNYVVLDLTSTSVLGVDSDMASITYLERVGLYLPALTTSNSVTKSLDLAYVAYFDNATVADYFGADASAYMNGGKKVTVSSSSDITLSNRNWSGGNNLAFGMLYSSQGGGWTGGINGGSSSNTSNGYDTWRVGYNLLNGYSHSSNTTRQNIFGDSFTAYYTASGSKTAATPDTDGTTNNIFYVSSSADDGNSSNTGFDMSKLDLDGYQLLTTLTQGGMTAGLLEGTLTNDMPVYRQEAVEYIAMLLYRTLTIPQFDADGDYNYNFVTGAPNSNLGGFDLNGDGKIGRADLNGDNYAETDEACLDAATALRGCLGIRFTLGAQRGTNPAMGNYDQTAKKDLIGEFKDVRNNITTCMDAAYFLLNNLFYANSYNQLQNDYSYLKLDHATMDNGKKAYVFDAGYTTGSEYAEGTTISSGSDYEQNSQSSIVYDPYASVDAEGNVVRGEGIISMKDVNSKDRFYYGSTVTTTRFPFLPVTDAEGDFEGATKPYYFYDDGVSSLTLDKGTYAERNFNYAMACNGEFVYHEEDGLFFEFEGDDDVYLFINGQLVLDLGGAHSISNESFEVNDYVDWARKIVDSVEAANGDLNAAGVSAEDYARAQKLDLTEGEICQFDFYYMERHGYGANCRIVTNMRVTDPELRTEKTASQTIEKKIDEENVEKITENIPYGGVVDYELPIAYYFKMTNTGNTKLYNLTFEDSDIGVTLDYINGLQVTGTYQGESVNGSYVLDSENGLLEAKDLTADVKGYELVGEGNGHYNKTADGQYVEAEGGMYEYAEVLDIKFADNQALINFLKTLDAEGTDKEQVDAELTQNGAGLWVDASVTIKGIHFVMNDDQVEAGYFDNTVYVSATTRTDPSDPDNQTRRSRANHRVYISGAPAYYQWAGHDLYLTEELIFTDATKAAGNGTGGQLSQYGDFFKKANNQVSNIESVLCDNSGKILDDQYYGDLVKWESSNKGLLVNFKETGTQVFYLYMYLKDSLRADSTKIQDGEYAIVRVTVHVADVEDSTFVLDYGLKTENLDTYGQLFKGDDLLSSVAGTTAKLMAVTKTAPSYLDYTSNKNGSYNRIKFNPFQLSSTTRLFTHTDEMDSDGAWTVNLDIPETGRVITYNANTGGYSLTDIGTVTIHANVPFTWDDVYLYWWYDNGISNDDFPGKEMTRTRAGKFVMDIPADVPHVIISRPETDDEGNVVTDTEGNIKYLQTSDLNLSMGKEAWIELSGKTNVGGRLAADVYYSVATSTMHAIVPDGWGDVYLYYWNETGEEGVDYPAWPGTQVTDPDGDGKYSLTEIPGNITNVIVNNGGERNADKQTNSLTIYAGRETTITVKDSYQATATSSDETKQTFTVRVNVPDDWTAANLYYWNNGEDGDFGKGWPGTAMTENADGSFSLEVPIQAEYVIVNGENGQTIDLPVVSGKDVTLTLGDKNGDGKYTAGYEYSGTYTLNVSVPDSWVANGEKINLHYWNSFGAVSGTNWPGEEMTKNGDGTYSLIVPNYADYIIFNNGSVQTADYKVPASSANMITLKVNEDYSIAVVNEATVAVEVTVPNNWGGVYLYYWNDTGVEGVDYPAWPGTAMFVNGSKYELTIPGSMTGMIINDGSERDAGNQTNTVDVPDSGSTSVVVKQIRATSSTTSNTTVTDETYKVTVKVPESWGDTVNLHHWKNGGTSSEWPGVPMTKNEDGTFTLEISSEYDYVIVNRPATDEDGNAILGGDGNPTYEQTGDISVIPGKDVYLTVNDDRSVDWEYEGTYKVTVTVPESWGSNINLYYCNEALGITEGWPGKAMTNNGDGTFSLDVPNYATKLVVNNVVDGVGTQSEDIVVGASTGATIHVAEYYSATVSYPQTSIMAHAMVPDHWVENGETIYLYSWNSSGQENAPFPGVPMTLGEGEYADVYSTEMFDIFTNVVISNGSHDGHKQSINLTVRTGLEPWITVHDNTIVEENVTRYTATVNNGNSAEEEGFFFTPIRFMDEAYKLWMAITVHAENENPTALGSDIDVHDEVQMYKQITVLPANVVYYEDDFTGISYDQSTGNTFDKIGGGSGSLKQSVDQSMEYGQDPYYQGSDNDPYSGNSLHKIKINSSDDIATFTFSGTGFEIIGNTNAYDSGMLTVKVYDADGYAKYQAGELTTIEPHMQVPVINEYDNGANGGSDSIEQVPVVRVSSITKLKTNADGSYVMDANGNYQYETLGYGRYTVEISGMPIYHFCGAQIKTEVVKAASCLTGGEAKSTCSGCGETWSYKLAAKGHSYSDGKCVSCGQAAPYSASDSCKHEYEVSAIQSAPTCLECGTGTYTCGLCGHSYTDAVKPTGHTYTDTVSKTNPSGYTYDALVCSECSNPFVPSGKHNNGIVGVEEAYLYIDGVRIFQPYNSGSSDLYRPGESGAAFSEIRDMIANKQMFVISTEIAGDYDEATNKTVVTISGGMNTWTENRIGFDSEGNSWSGNTVGDITEYIYAGPNNEAYLAAGQNNPSALAFYVTEKVAGNGELQVAIRGIDYGTFFGNANSSLNATLMLGVIAEDGSYGWKPLAEVISGTEQYYTIPYTECPKDSTGRYQIVLQIVNTSGSNVTGMVSFSSLKSNGVTIPTLSGDKFELTYSYDSSSLIDPISGETVNAEEYVNFAMITKQMGSSTLVLDEDMVPGSTHTGHTYQDGHCTICGAADPNYQAPVTKPTLTLVAPTLNFEDEIYYNIYYTVDNMEDVVEMGLITFNQSTPNGTVENADAVIPGYTQIGSEYMSHSNGIPAKMLGDALYFKAYAKLADGSYVYSSMANYDAVAYAKDRLANSDNTKTHQLVIAMLNYGAAAQVQFNYKTDSLMNAFLTAEQQALVSQYSADMIEGLTVVDGSKVGDFAGVIGSVDYIYPTVSFEGAFSVNFYFAPAKAMDGDLTLYYWTLEDYNSASVLTAENASGSVIMEAGAAAGEYLGVVEGIAAKEIDETIFVAGVYESDGVTYCTGVLAYSLATYCLDRIANGTPNMQAFAKSTVVYGYYAKAYFA